MSRSCDSCHQKKIHCDRKKPICEWCEHRHLQCTFTRPYRVKNTKSSLPKQIQEENELIDHPYAIRRGEAADSTSSSPIINPVMNMNEDSETYISDLLDNLQASLCNSVLSLGSQKWIARCTLGRRDMIRPEFPNNPFQTWTTSKPIQQGADFGLRLLSQPLVQKCLILYNSTRMARTFPIIDTPCFQSTIIAFFEGHICRASEACLFAFTAFIAYHFSEVSLLIDLEKCELQARSLVPEILTQPATFDGIRTMLMLALGRGCSGDYEAIHTYVGIAAQMIYSLGGHLNTRSHARDLFWVTYFLDKDLTMRTGRRPTISDEHCDLTLPELYCERIIYLDAHDQPFPSDLRLSVIKSKIFNCLYSSSARKVCNTDIIRAVRELDEELEEWRVSLPSEHRPSLSQCDYAPCEEIRWIFIQSEYIHCIRMIHEATSRCIVWAENNDNLEALSSSLAISIEASRAYLTFLYSVPRQDFSFASYWVFSYYVVGTSLLLFYNILLNPAHVRALQDLELIGRATLTLSRFPSRCVYGDSAEKKLLNNHFSELHILAKKAISSTQSGRFLATGGR